MNNNEKEARLLKDILATGRPAPGEHLSEDGFLDYVTGTMDAEGKRAAEAHLECCSECTKMAALLFGAAEAVR